MYIIIPVKIIRYIVKNINIIGHNIIGLSPTSPLAWPFFQLTYSFIYYLLLPLNPNLLPE
ncbi:MAG: hypothetical protein US85_C0001G0054 [Candidatus Shapirobacteria bacterium GW2011_GWF1_38_23]|nr:MAG: hypothetical protein US85_C0001G0054 [Candidatus Shapirobacteria bacterium GW2011_GWF1_38_23]